MCRHTVAGTQQFADGDGLFANVARRYLVYHLYLRRPPTALAAIADQITIWETTDLPEEHPRERLHNYMALYHDHLPELTDAGYVAYDQIEDTVQRGTLWDRIEPFVADSLSEEYTELLAAETATIRRTDA